MGDITFVILFLCSLFKIGFTYDMDYISSIRSDNCRSLNFLVNCNKKCDGIALCHQGECVCPKVQKYGDVFEVQATHPILRHHIAHFCPNLEVARGCIRKCMNEGLPAFCGKDHVCYCGHKYSSNDKDPKMDFEIVHNQFKDLYEKYFGPEPKKVWMEEDSQKKLSNA